MTNFIIGTLYGLACSIVVYIFAEGMANCIKANEEENQRKQQKEKRRIKMKKVIIEHSPFFVCKCRKCACKFEYTHNEVQNGWGSTYVVSCPVCNSYNTHNIENQPKRKRRKEQ